MRAPIPIDAEGRFAGYASAFGLVDESGDVVMPGAFAKSLAKRGKAGIRMLFQHDPRRSARTLLASGSRAGWCRACRGPMHSGG